MKIRCSPIRNFEVRNLLMRTLRVIIILVIVSTIITILSLIVNADEGRRYYQISIDGFSKNKHTHVCTTGKVVYVRGELDGNLYIKIEGHGRKGKTQHFIVAVIIPTLLIDWEEGRPPHQGERWTACGIRRYDDKSHVWQIHPVEKAWRRLQLN